MLFCLIPVLILGSLSIFITQRYIGEGIEADNEQTLRQYGDFLQIVAGEMDSLSLSFDQDPKILMMLKRVLTKPSFSYDEREALFYLRNVIEVPANSKPYIHSIYVYYDNPAGRFLSSREGLTHPDSFFDGGWLETVGRPFRGEMRTDARQIQEFALASATRDIVTVSKPIASGKGVIAINVDPSYFARSFEEQRQFPDQTLLVTDGAFRPFLLSGPELSGAAAARLKQAAEGSAEAAGGSPVSFAEAGRHVTVMPIPRLDWFLATSVPSRSLYGPVRTLTEFTVLLSLFSVLISCLFAFGMTRKHYRQVDGIIRTLNSADQQTLPQEGGRIRDLYELIVQRILEAFLQQRYLKIQLSERKYREEVLELRALQSQMNPHFLSNTLHSVYWKSVELTRSPNAVSRMIEQLSDMLDYAVRTAEDLVSLEEEALYCRNYVHIQQMRHPDRLTVVWESFEGLETCRVLKLSLQPLIENSIQYGLEQGDAERLAVKIRFRMEERTLKITVIDNGPGIGPERLAEIEGMLSSDDGPSAHVGLANTYRRLGLKYGPHSKLRMIGRSGRGTAVTLYFPQDLS